MDVAFGPDHALYVVMRDDRVLRITSTGSSACVADVTTQGAGSSDPLWGVPDCLATAADINYYVGDWLPGFPTADLTTQGDGIGDPGYGVPDGIVTAADLSYFVNLWIVGCP